MLEAIHIAPEHGTMRPVADGEKVAVIVKAVVGAADAWNHSNAQAAVIFDVPTVALRRMKEGTYRC